MLTLDQVADWLELNNLSYWVLFRNRSRVADVGGREGSVTEAIKHLRKNMELLPSGVYQIRAQTSVKATTSAMEQEFKHGTAEASTAYHVPASSSGASHNELFDAYERGFKAGQDAERSRIREDEMLKTLREINQKLTNDNPDDDEEAGSMLDKLTENAPKVLDLMNNAKQMLGR